MLRAVTQERMKAMIARYLGGERTPDERTQLIAAIEHVSLAETARWQQLLRQTRADAESSPPDQHPAGRVPPHGQDSR